MLERENEFLREQVQTKDDQIGTDASQYLGLRVLEAGGFRRRHWTVEIHSLRCRAISLQMIVFDS
jgi:hypothetical protein